MKTTLKTKFLAMAAVLALPVFQSCLSNNDDYDYSILSPDAIVTVKPVVNDGADYFYLQLNDEEKLWPLDNSSLPYKEKEMRAFVNFTETDMPSDVKGEGYSKAVKINWMDSILTKKTVVFELPRNTEMILWKYTQTG